MSPEKLIGCPENDVRMRVKLIVPGRVPQLSGWPGRVPKETG
jgi:hypothetical protein